MRSGAKNCVVSIYNYTETADPNYNSPVKTLSVWKSDVFCNITARRGREVPVEGQIIFETYAKFDFEYFDVEGITSDMMIRHEGQDFQIVGILADFARKDYIAVDTVYRKIPTGRM